MLSRGRVAGLPWSPVAVALMAGCATPASTVAPAVMDGGASAPAAGASMHVAPLAGVWEGEVWEMPTHCLQGVRCITLSIARDGRWTASSGGATLSRR